MKNHKLKIVFILFGFLSFNSCLDDDSDPNTPLVVCNDNDYYALLGDNQINDDNLVEVVKNTSNNITTSNYVIQTGVDFLPEARNSNATWNKVSNTLFYLDESEREYALTYDLATNTANSHNIQSFTTGQLSAPVYNQNKLLVLDFDASGNVDIKTINSAITILSGSIINIPVNSLTGNSADTQETLAYGATDEDCLIFFLVGNSIIEFDQCSTSLTSPPYTIHNINLPGDYIDIAYRQNGNLISVRKNGSNLDVVELDIISSPGTATVITKLANINAYPESIQLTYKECGDRLHVLTHFTFTGLPANTESKIIEINLENLNFVEQDFPGWIFGMVHDQQ